MNSSNPTERPSLRIRLLHLLGKEPDWSAMSATDLAAFSKAENHKRESPIARVITGFPDRGATINWQEIPLHGRTLRVRVYRPSQTRHHTDDGALPLVVHIHGGGLVGTAVQSDWVNSRLAARLPAVVVSVEHRLLSPMISLSMATDDGWDVLNTLIQHASEWGIDPTRVAIFGESTGGAIAALIAIHARDSGLPLRAQILVNPCLDVTSSMLSYNSVTQYADNPILTMPLIQLFARLAVPPDTDARKLSPLQANDLGNLAPALVVVPTVDPVSDHGRRYAERLTGAGTFAQMTEYPGATHAFLSMPGAVSQAKMAQAEILEFLREQLKRKEKP